MLNSFASQGGNQSCVPICMKFILSILAGNSLRLASFSVSFHYTTGGGDYSRVNKLGIV